MPLPPACGAHACVARGRHVAMKAWSAKEPSGPSGRVPPTPCPGDAERPRGSGGRHRHRPDRPRRSERLWRQKLCVNSLWSVLSLRVSSTEAPSQLAAGRGSPTSQVSQRRSAGPAASAGPQGALHREQQEWAGRLALEGTGSHRRALSSWTPPAVPSPPQEAACASLFPERAG